MNSHHNRFGRLVARRRAHEAKLRSVNDFFDHVRERMGVAACFAPHPSGQHRCGRPKPHVGQPHMCSCGVAWGDPPTQSLLN